MVTFVLSIIAILEKNAIQFSNKQYSRVKENVMLKLIISICSIILLCSCVTTPIKPAGYAGDLPIYPAVVQSLKKHADLVEIDIYKDEFVSDYIEVVDFLLTKRFKVLIKKEGRYIKATSVNMQLQEAETGRWIDNSVMLSFDTNKFLNDITNEVSAILSNSKRYTKAKNKTLADLSFIYLVMKDLTDVGRERWVNENLIGRDYNINLPLNGFKQNKNKSIKKPYVANFSCGKKLHGFYSTTFYLELYTDKDYAYVKINNDVSTQGSLVEVSKHIDGAFSLSLVEN